MIGELVKQDALKYPLSFDSDAPLFTNWLFEQVPLSWARSWLIPKTLVEFVAAMVSALPD